MKDGLYGIGLKVVQKVKKDSLIKKMSLDQKQQFLIQELLVIQGR